MRIAAAALLRLPAAYAFEADPGIAGGQAGDGQEALVGVEGGGGGENAGDGGVRHLEEVGVCFCSRRSTSSPVLVAH